jgi:hypothetical protein
MAQVAVDLTPVVSSLLDRPFDQPSLDRAYAAVGGHPQAYATALRCAAKKTSDTLAAAYWFAEAARVHENMDDLGGAIALLWRALECDRSNPRPRELLAGAMARLSMRAGIGFTFAPAAVPPSDRTGAGSFPLETGIRPPSTEKRSRDTLPDLFGTDVSPGSGEASARQPPAVGNDGPAFSNASRATMPSAVARTSSAPPPASGTLPKEEPRVAQLLPPRDPSTELASALPLVRHQRSEPMLLAIAKATTPSKKSAVEPESIEADDVYAEPEAPPTVRPSGDRLMGSLFEALHALHFLEDVREGALFLGRTLSEKMRPATTLVHLYDINSGHFLVVSAEGSRAVALADYPTPEDDAFIVEVMKNEESTLVRDPATDPRFRRGRWALAEPNRSVLCAPVASDGRRLGLIEMADPVDGGEFTENDRNAVAYAASAFGQFLRRHGLVLSGEPERSSPGPLPAL